MRNNSGRTASVSPSSTPTRSSSQTNTRQHSIISSPAADVCSTQSSSIIVNSQQPLTLNPNSMATVGGPPSRPVKNDRLCRNILIYGSCRFEDKGCVYAHTAGLNPTAAPASINHLGTPGLAALSHAVQTKANLESDANAHMNMNPNDESLDHASATPNPMLAGVPRSMTESISAPVFKPSSTNSKTSVVAHSRFLTESMSSSISTEHLKAASFVPRSTASPGPTQSTDKEGSQRQEGKTVKLKDDIEGAFVLTSTKFEDTSGIEEKTMTQIDLNDRPLYLTDTRALDHHLYTTPLPHTANLPASHLPLHNFFLPPDLLSFIHYRSEAKLETRSADNALPAEVHVYHSLHTLFADCTPQERNIRVFGYITDAYRARCRLDGRLYCLRRVEGFKLVKDTAFSVLDKWRRIRHPNIVSVREAFTTRLFNDSSVIFAYDFHPNSRTLFEAHLGNQIDMIGQANGKILPSQKPPIGIPERLLWSYIAQIGNGLKAIHTAGLACRTIEPTKIILTARNRVRLNCCSIFDVTTYDSPSSNLHYQQQDDLLNFGKLLVALCCGSTAAVHSLAASLEAIQNSYSPDVKLVILYLLGKPGPGKSVDDILVMLGPRLLNEFDAMQNYADSLETGLEAEVENGRVARMLIKLGFINERPEYQQDPRWSETGDRYLLKLFRDYVFHSVDELGNPVLDLTHVLTTLNKTDSSLDERIMLVARDEQSCMVISYREIRNSIEKAYQELVQQSTGLL